MMLNYLVVDNLSTTIPGQIRDKKVIFNKFSDLYIVENQMVILRETGLIKSPIHYQTDGCTQVRPFFCFASPGALSGCFNPCRLFLRSVPLCAPILFVIEKGLLVMIVPGFVELICRRRAGPLFLLQNCK